MAEQVKIRMTIQEFMERYEEQPFELIRGEIWEMSPVKFGHSESAKIIYDGIYDYLKENPIGAVYSETVFILEDKTDWVDGSRVPDVMYVEQTRLDQYRAANPDYRDKPLVLVPDLVIEVISPKDSYSKVNEKIEAYLSDGVRLLWIVDPQRKTIAVYEGSDTPKTLREGDVLSGGAVLVGFEMGVDTVFGA